LSALYNEDANVDLEWSADKQESLYAIQFKRKADNQWHPNDQFLAEQSSLKNFTMKEADICEELEFRVAAISPTSGFGHFSDVFVIPILEPVISSELKLLGLQFKVSVGVHFKGINVFSQSDLKIKAVQAMAR
jgi:hypothetical protein